MARIHTQEFGCPRSGFLDLGRLLSQGSPTAQCAQRAIHRPFLTGCEKTLWLQEASGTTSQAAEKLVQAVGPGFIPGIKPMESAFALATAVCFLSDSFENRAFSAASLARNPDRWACFVRHCVYWLFGVNLENWRLPGYPHTRRNRETDSGSIPPQFSRNALLQNIEPIIVLPCFFCSRRSSKPCMAAQGRSTV